MNIVNHERIHELIDHRSSLCVSIFIPTHRTGREQQQDPIRLKNLTRRARERMLAETDSATEVDAALRPLVDLRTDEHFWLHQGDGLACFCTADFFRAYRIPLPVDEQLFVNKRFYIRPLLPLLRSDARLYVLSLTQETAKLFEATRYSIREIELPDITPLEVDGTEQALQYHSHQSPARGKGDADSAIYHGQGGPADRSKKDTLRFFQRVDRAIARTLRGQRSPLVLACVGYLAPLYESANSYSGLIKGKIPGSPERWSDDELRDHAWRLVEPEFRRQQEEALETCQAVNRSERGSNDLPTIVLAADQGRVDTLFVTRDQQCWGHIDRDGQAVRMDDDAEADEELLDYAATRTLSNGGEVFVVDELPQSDASAAATFRY